MSHQRSDDVFVDGDLLPSRISLMPQMRVSPQSASTGIASQQGNDHRVHTSQRVVGRIWSTWQTEIPTIRSLRWPVTSGAVSQLNSAKQIICHSCTNPFGGGYSGPTSSFHPHLSKTKVFLSLNKTGLAMALQQFQYRECG